MSISLEPPRAPPNCQSNPRSTQYLLGLAAPELRESESITRAACGVGRPPRWCAWTSSAAEMDVDPEVLAVEPETGPRSRSFGRLSRASGSGGGDYLALALDEEPASKPRRSKSPWRERDGVTAKDVVPPVSPPDLLDDEPTEDVLLSPKSRLLFKKKPAQELALEHLTRALSEVCQRPGKLACVTDGS